VRISRERLFNESGGNAMQDVKWVVPETMCRQQRRPTLEDFARIRLGSSRVVSRDGAVVRVDEFDSDDDSRSPLFVHGYCVEMANGSQRGLAGQTVDVRWLDIVEVMP
jgi:hypothetical protein